MALYLHSPYTPSLSVGRQDALPYNRYVQSSVAGLVLPYFLHVSPRRRGPGSSVGIETDYGLEGPGIESRRGEIFRRPEGPWGPTSLL